LLAVKKNFTLRVDGGLARSIVNEGLNDYLSVHSSMYIAGLSPDTGEKALKLWHLRNATSFNGCLKEVYVNDKLVDFLQAAKARHKVSPGCSLYQDEQPDLTNPCKQNKCKQGQCTPAENGTYKCICRTGFTGDFCHVQDEEPMRQRSKTRSRKRSRSRSSRKGRGYLRSAVRRSLGITTLSQTVADL